MIKVALINGRPSSGKTTFEKICSEKCDYFSHTQGFRPNYYLHINIISTIDFIKKIAYDCGWDGTKTLENRKFLSKLKDLLTEWNDVPYKKIIEHINSLPKDSDWIVFVDCREPKEIQRLKDKKMYNRSVTMADIVKNIMEKVA